VRVLAAAETQAAQRAFGGWLRELRGARRGLLLQADVETDGELLGVRLPRGGAETPRPGLGFLVAPGSVELVQVAGED
jgi:S-DNA-T family DNA segregation ATPase FtsK/SpoIIIE